MNEARYNEMTGGTPGITPLNDGPGNDAYQSMRAQLAAVTARERGR